MKKVKFLRYQYCDILHNIISSLGVLNSENFWFRKLFVDEGGLAAVLGIVEFYSERGEEADYTAIDSDYDEEEYEFQNMELESVVTFALTAACYDQDGDDYGCEEMSM